MAATTEHRRMSATERLEQLHDFVALHERPPSRRLGDPEEKSLGEWIAKHKNASTRTGEAVRELLAGGALAAWVRINVQAKSCPAREVERIYRADQHHAQRIAAGRLNGLVAFITATGRAPRADSTNEREAQLAKWAMEYCKDTTRTYARQAISRSPRLA